jgi:hypothetical protein
MPLATSPLPATLTTLPAVRLPTLTRAARLPVSRHPDMAPARPVPETVNPQMTGSGRWSWSLHAYRRRLHHDNAAVLVSTTAAMSGIRRHHTAGQSAAKHQQGQRQGQRTPRWKGHLGCDRGHGGRSAQRRRSGRTGPCNGPVLVCADARPVQRANWRCTKAQISAAASGPVGSLNGRDLAPPLHAWPMPVTRHRLTTTRRPTR